MHRKKAKSPGTFPKQLGLLCGDGIKGNAHLKQATDTVARRRCLEYDHRRPFALGGSSDDAENIRLLCRAHNRLHAEYAFGKGFVAKKICPEISPFQER